MASSILNAQRLLSRRLIAGSSSSTSALLQQRSKITFAGKLCRAASTTSTNQSLITSATCTAPTNSFRTGSIAFSNPHQQLYKQQRAWFSSYPPHEVVGLPKLSPTMESGSVSNWNFKEGQAFTAGDILCSIETDKATVDFEAQDEGVLAKILVPAGPDEVQLGQPIMITVEEAADAAAFKDYVVEAAAATAAPIPPPAAATPEPAAPAAPAAPTPAAAPAAAAPAGGRVIASPLARLLSKEMGYDINSIPGTGPDGRVIAADVREFVPSTVTAAAAAAAPAAAPSVSEPAPAQVAAAVQTPIPGAGYTDYPLDASAQEIAARLAQSKRNVPHYYLTVDITMDELLKIRSTLNATMRDDKLGVYELLIKAAGAAMKAVPSANASWMESVVRVYDSVDINVVMGAGDSLFTPVIRDCGKKGVKGISEDLSKASSYLEEQAKTEEGGEVSIVDNGDFSALGTFTIINLGMYGVKSCAPIIREPQACALALGTLENRIVPNDKPDDDQIYKESVVMTATLSCDHRVVDGAVGAQWLSAFKSHVENPATLLL